MISRFATAAALAMGTALFCLPTQAQTGTSSPGTSSPGTSSQSTIDSGGASSGSVGAGNAPGTYSPSPTPTMGGTAGTTSSNSMGAQGNAYGSAGGGMGYQAQATTTGSGRMHRGDAAERQITECLNNAAAQHQSLDSCRR
jgi:hypothetical protein